MLVEIYCDKFKTGGKDGEVRAPITFHEVSHKRIDTRNLVIKLHESPDVHSSVHIHRYFDLEFQCRFDFLP